MKKRLIILAFFMGFSLFLGGCFNVIQEEQFDYEIVVANEHSVQFEINDLPKITLRKVFENKSTNIEFNFQDFWYSDTANCFVQFGKIFEKQNALDEFEDELIITYKHDESVTASVMLKRIIIPLETLVLDGENKKNTCVVGESLNLIETAFPQGSNGFELEYSILNSYSNASIDQNNNLLISQNATPGDVVSIQASFQEIQSNVFEVTVVSRIQIDSAEDLYNIRYNKNLDYELSANIDLSAYESWIPIYDFEGTLDGKDYSISNAEIRIPTEYFATQKNFGIFAQNYGTIKNITIKESKISASPYHEGEVMYAGILVAENRGMVENCHIEDVELVIHRQRSSYGGLVGATIGGKIQNCTATNTTLKGNGDMGAITGLTNYGAVIENCTATKTSLQYYSTHKNRSIGGIVGIARRSRIVNCHVQDTKLEVYGFKKKYKVKPEMGPVIGHLASSYVSNISHTNTSFDLQNLPENVKQSIPFGTWYNTRIYIANNGIDMIGRIQNSIIE